MLSFSSINKNFYQSPPGMDPLSSMPKLKRHAPEASADTNRQKSRGPEEIYPNDGRFDNETHKLMRNDENSRVFSKTR